MHMMKAARLGLALALLTAISPAGPALANVDCSIGEKTGNPFCVSQMAQTSVQTAPYPGAGTGALGAMILLAGLIAARRARRT